MKLPQLRMPDAHAAVKTKGELSSFYMTSTCFDWIPGIHNKSGGLVKVMGFDEVHFRTLL